jgi:Spy/CpxP family protein refolding chaperone
MMGSRRRALLLLAVTFVVSAALGVGGTLLALRPAGWHRHPDREHGGYVARLDRELGLAPAQRDSVHAVLERHRPAMDSLWRATRAPIETLRMRIRSEIRTHLTPEQRERYDEMLRRRHERARDHR